MNSSKNLLPGLGNDGVLVLALIVALCTGCSSMLPESTPFGAVSSPDHFRTINGLGVHRRMWETAGAKVLTPQKISPRLDTFDTIVLVGQTFEPPGQEARDWIEAWLGRKKGRTAIYFGRDLNADIYYRQRTMTQISPVEHELGEQALALSRASELSKRTNDLPESTFCGWFYLDVEQAPSTHTEFTEAWSSDLTGLQGEWPTSVVLRPPLKSFKSKKPSWLTNTAVNPLKPAGAFDPFAGSDSQRSLWAPGELDTNAAWNKAFADLPKSETLLAADDGTPLIFRLTHSRRYPGSKLLIVANGAPLLNGTLVEPLHQRVGEKLIEECLPAERVALLAYSYNGIYISTAPEADPRGAGLEMLTIWPLSAITMPALLLGIVFCAMLIPIMGRPQSLPSESVNDFGLHVEALGKMLYQSQDLEYARDSINEYFQRVRGEAAPPWLEQIGRPPTPQPTPLPSPRLPKDNTD
jgi:hypothetical protein